MAHPYDHIAVEEKWLQQWEDSLLFQDTARVKENLDNSDKLEKSDKSSNSSHLSQSPVSSHSSQSSKDKLYLLFAFAYPSGSGLHVGHVESKTALDILARYNRMQGKDVFFPVGWDAFGLPAENYAIKTGVPPAKTTKQAIDTFRRQIKRIGISYDWANELATSHPEYYKWTQWIFIQLFNKNLAYKKPGSVNWCPSCQTVLANEQVVQKTIELLDKSVNKDKLDNSDSNSAHSSQLSDSSQVASMGVCERCDTQVVQKYLDQWYFKITQYKDELIDGLDQVDWPKATADQQRHWIGRSEGANVKFKLQVTSHKSQDQKEDYLEVYTTAHDTIYGCTFMVVAPEHELLETYKQQIANWEEVAAYIKQANSKTELERQSQKEKTGVKVEGVELINPINGETVPLFVADYVLSGYGTGAIMAVPGHDERDYEFAQKYGLEIIQTAKPKQQDQSDQPFIGYAEIKADRESYELINSAEFNGMDYKKGRQAILDKLEKQSAGEASRQYKLRDWLISRQRYWGAPIPIVYDPEGKPHPVKEEHLPWTLPTDVEFKPTGESPLKLSKELKNRVEKLYGKGWTPEYDTMDTFVDSSWYFLGYPNRNTDEWYSLGTSNKQQATGDKKQETNKPQTTNINNQPINQLTNQPTASSHTHSPFNEDLMRYWLPVDFYMIGPEHIVLHLLYARFFTKFLRDEGYLCEVMSKETRNKEQGTSKRKPINQLTNQPTKLNDHLDPHDHQAHQEAGLFCVSEPFTKMRHQGMILGPDHKKMSKSKGNVIDPDVVIKEYGADALRVYEMFMGPIDADKPWNDRSVNGVKRFLNELYGLVTDNAAQLSSNANSKPTQSLQKSLHRTIKKVTEDVPELKFNTAIAALMEFKNEFKTAVSENPTPLTQSDLEMLIKIVAPFAPFLAEEMWSKLQVTRNKKQETNKSQPSVINHQSSIHLQPWPAFDPGMITLEEISFAVQVNGKLRDTITVPADQATEKDSVLEQAQTTDKIKTWLEQGTLRKTIFIPPKPGKSGLVNFVVT